jgi:hypothetical protein
LLLELFVHDVRDFQAKPCKDGSDRATINGWMGRTGGSSLGDLWTMKLLKRAIFCLQAHFRLHVLASMLMLMGENFLETDSIRISIICPLRRDAAGTADWSS